MPDGSPKIETDKSTGEDFGRPIVCGTYLDVAADLVCKAAGISNPKFKGPWDPLLAWLRDGFDLHGVILPAISRVAARTSYVPVGSLKYFDRPVREFPSARPSGR
jgi:hypothetical protein